MIFTLLTAIATCLRARQMNEDTVHALRLSGYSLKAAAIEMGLTPQQLNAQLHGVGHLSASRLARLSDQFHAWLAIVRARRCGVPAELTIGQLIERRLRDAQMAEECAS